MGVKLQSSSGGSVEIAAPVTASNYVLTAPATSSTIDTLARAGNVLQVVNATYSTRVDSTSSTYADSGLSASITPTSASSKILIFIYQNGCYKSANTRVALRLLRGATVLTTFESNAGATDSTAVNAVGSAGVTYLDSPASATAVTYKTQLASLQNTGLVSVQLDNSSTSTITLMEIAG